MDILGVITPNERKHQVEATYVRKVATIQNERKPQVGEVERLKLGNGSVEVIRDEQGQGWVSVKRACEILDLSHDAQRRRLMKQDWAVISTVYAVSSDNKKYKHFCVATNCLPMWLNTLNKSRVRGHNTEAYFIRSLRTGYIKIGTSSNAKERLRGLASHYPDRLELLAVGGVEEELHQSLSKHRVHGEWFEPHKSVLLAVRTAGGDPNNPILVAGMKGKL